VKVVSIETTAGARVAEFLSIVSELLCIIHERKAGLHAIIFSQAVVHNLIFEFGLGIPHSIPPQVCTYERSPTDVDISGIAWGFGSI